MDTSIAVLISVVILLALIFTVTWIVKSRHLLSLHFLHSSKKLSIAEIIPEASSSRDKPLDSDFENIHLPLVANEIYSQSDHNAEELQGSEREATSSSTEFESLPATNKLDSSDFSEDLNHEADLSSISEPSIIFRPPHTTSKNLPIGLRGGRPRKGIERNNDGSSKTPQKGVRALKPDIVCWCSARKWFVGLEIPEEFQSYKGLKVHQDTVLLEQDNKGRWLLIKTGGRVSVTWDEAEYSPEIELGTRPYLLFKLSGKNVDRGLLIHQATVGLFLAIIPNGWLPSEGTSAINIPLSKYVFDDDYQAYGFDRQDNQKIVFITLLGESIALSASSTKFELVGNRLSYISDNVGPLFGGRLPIMRAVEQETWREVNTIVVGEEGTGRKRQTISFSPKADNLLQEFPHQLYQKGGGWYFVRFYDFSDRLIDSLDFRFVKALRDIEISPNSVLAGPHGHLPANIEFLHDEVCAIEPISSLNADLVVECKDNSKTIVTIPPMPIWDETCWIIHAPEGIEVEAKILVERVWWKIYAKSGKEMPSEWMDTPLILSHDFVAPTSTYFLCIRLPRRRWTNRISVGFEKQRARYYPVEVTKQEVMVPLSELGDFREFANREQTHSLKLWINNSDNEDLTAVIAVIPATKFGHREQQIHNARSSIRRLRNYLKRLGYRIQDSRLLQMINGAREKWSGSLTKPDVDLHRVVTACTIVLAWESLRAKNMKPLGRRKRWLRKLVRLAADHPDIMQEVRAKYEMLNSRPINASSEMEKTIEVGNGSSGINAKN